MAEDEKLPNDQEPEDEFVSEWSGWEVFLSNFKPKDVKDFTDKLFAFLKQKAEVQSNLERRRLAQQILETRHQVRVAKLYQWLRFFIILVCAGASTYLICIDKFTSAAALFFGGIVAYLFGKQPK